MTLTFINADDPIFLGVTGSAISYNLFAYCENKPVVYLDTTGTFLGTLIRAVVGAVVGAIDAAVDGGSAKDITEKVCEAWNWTSQAATDAWNWTKGAAIAVKNFAVDRFSTPEKAANTLTAIGLAIDAVAAYLGLAAAGLAVPTSGMSVATAGAAAAILAAVSLPFHGAAVVLGILGEK